MAELRRPGGPPSGAPNPNREPKETQELIFSQLSCLAVLLEARAHDDRGVGQHGGYTPASRLMRGTCSLGLYRNSLILDINVMVN